MEINLLHMPLKGYLDWERCRKKESLATLQSLVLVCTFQHIPAKPLPSTVMSSFGSVSNQKGYNPLLNTVVNPHTSLFQTVLEYAKTNKPKNL